MSAKLYYCDEDDVRMCACGSGELTITDAFPEYGWHRILCTNCGAATRKEYSTIHGAIVAWNKEVVS